AKLFIKDCKFQAEGFRVLIFEVLVMFFDGEGLFMIFVWVLIFEVEGDVFGGELLSVMRFFLES
ncbi:MAG: hypothetical protein B7Y15_13790, partial [Bacteroidetes bacterium 24-39-8]